MPNHIKQIIVVTAPNASDIIDSLKGVEIYEEMGETKAEEREISFQTVIQRPIEEDENWHRWNSDNWGTKWDAYDVSVDLDGNMFTCNTAWSMAFPVWEALSKKYPEALFEVTYADEDMGSNCGRIVLKNGDIVNQHIAPSWSEMSGAEKRTWWDFAATVREFGDDEKAECLAEMEEDGCFDD